MKVISKFRQDILKIFFLLICSSLLAHGQTASKAFYFSNMPQDTIVLDSINSFIHKFQSDLLCDCASQESILSSAINMYVSGTCIYGSTGSTGCGNSLQYLWMKCNMDGTNCVEQTGWINGGSGSLCPSVAGWYTFCVRFDGCTSTNVGEVPLQYVGGGGGGGGGCDVSASISGTTTFCTGSSTTLTATGSGSSGYSYRWTNGSTSKSITVSSGGYYAVTITDANGCTADAGVQVTAQTCSTNNRPTCSAVNVSTCVGNAVTGSFLGYDADGDALTYTIATQPSSGSVVKSGRNFTYTPAASTLAGTYTFTYKVSDGSLTSSSCTVTITVNSCNNTPTCNSVAVSTCVGQAVTGNFSGNDPDGDALTYTLVSQPSSGSVSTNASGFTYTPSGSTTGIFSFSYKVSDATLSSSSCTVSVTVTACNNAPTCYSVMANTCAAQAVVGNFSGNDPDGDALTYSIVAAPNASTQGSVQVNGSQFTFTPVATASGIITFTYKVSDSKGMSSANCTVSIDIVSCNNCIKPYAGEDQAICLPKTKVDLLNAPVGYQWVVSAANSLPSFIDASTGLATGLNSIGLYIYRLEKVGDATCYDEVMVSVGAGDAPIVLCDDGIVSYNIVAPTYLANVLWYNSAGVQVGFGGILTVKSTTLGLEDGAESFYYRGVNGNATGCDIEMCCPMKFISQKCCTKPLCIDILCTHNK